MSDAVQELERPRQVDGPTAGTLLRRAREAAGMHVAALAVSLKVPVRKLEALEGDRYDQLTDAVFARGLAASVCRVLKVDPGPILDRLPQLGAPRLVHDTERINAPFRAPGDGAPPTWQSALLKPVPLAVLALLAGAVAILLWPAGTPATNAGARTAPQPAMVTTPVAVAQPEPAVAAPVPLQVTAAASAPALAAAVQESAPAGSTLVIRSKGGSWVEVTDARGIVAMRKLLAPGEAADVSGALPLQVTIGRADGTEVEVRGRPFDLSAVSKDNVARFEVK